MEYKALIVKCSNCGIIWLAHRTEFKKGTCIYCPQCQFLDEAKIIKREPA